LPNSLNTQAVPDVEVGTISEYIQMGQSIVSGAATRTASELVFGLYKMKTKGCSPEYLSYTYQKTVARLSALGRSITLSRVVSGYNKLLNEDYVIPPNLSNSSSPTTTKKAPSRASQ